MKPNRAISQAISMVLVIVFLFVGLGIGYVAGGSGAAAHTTTTTSYGTSTQTTTQMTTQTTTITASTINTGNLVNYWIQAYESTPWQYFQLSRTQLVPLLNAGNSSIYIMDLRQATGTAGYVTGHIGSAINIPFQNVTAALTAGLIPKNKIIIDVCYTGQTGAQTTAILRALGYTAFNLSGGMAGWNNATRVSSSAPIAVGENYPIVAGAAPGVWTVFNP